MTKYLYTFLLSAISLLGMAENMFVQDRHLLDAYLTNDMSVWKSHIDTASLTPHLLAYEYGYCAALLDTDKEAAKPYVQRYRKHVEALQHYLPAGYFEMYMSSVYVYELRLHESFHPVKSLSLAREAVKLAPEDPLALTYCGTTLFYAPKPFGDKTEALALFLRAEERFRSSQWYNCWWRPAALMYIAQCYDKQGDSAEAAKRANALLSEYPQYLFIRDTFLPALNAKK